MKLVPIVTIVLFIFILLLPACSDSDKKEEVVTQAEAVTEPVIAPEPEPEISSDYLTTDEIVGTRLEESDLVIDMSDEPDPAETFSEAEKLVCDDENLPEFIVGKEAVMISCPNNDWTSKACIKTNVSHCRLTESFCRCAFGNNYADSEFRRHDTWLQKGQNEFTYLYEPIK